MMRVIVVILLISVICPTSLLAATECSQWQDRNPEWIWCDDFEGNTDLQNRYEDSSLIGMGVTQNQVFEGNQSLEQKYQLGQVAAGWITKVDNNGFPEHLFIRWYHYMPSGYGETLPQKMARMRLRQRSGDWRDIYALHAWIKKNVITISPYAKDSSQANNSGWLATQFSNVDFTKAENLNRWIAFEIEIRLNSPDQTNGLYRMWTDDRLVIEQTGLDIRGNSNGKINEVMLDTYFNGGSPGNLSRYYDNLVISNSKIGLAAATAPSAPLPPKNLQANKMINEQTSTTPGQ